MSLSDLASPAEAGFAKAGNRQPPSDQVQGHAFPGHAPCHWTITVTTQARSGRRGFAAPSAPGTGAI